MIRLRWFLLLLALATVFSAWRVWWVAENRSAESLLAAAQARIERDSTDHDAALRELELALRLATEEGRRPVAEEILRTRAQVNMQRRNPRLALEDCDLLLQGFAPADPFVLDMAARSAFQLDELQRAIDYAARLVEARPDQPTAHNLLGRLHRALAEEALDEIYARLDERLPTRLAAQGLEDARRAAALPAANPHARAAFEALDELAEDREDRLTHRALTERARTHLEAAREAWLGALAVGRTGESVEGLQELLARGGLHEEVTGLGRAALAKPGFPGAGGVVVRTALAEARLARPAAAAELIATAQSKRPDVLRPEALDDETLIEWMVLMHDLELWSELEATVKVVYERRNLVRDRSDLRPTLSYLLGLALLEQNRTQAAMPSLTRAGRYPDSSELVRGEQVLAWTTRATAERRMAMRQEERRSMAEATRTPAVPEPDGSRAARAYGEALERQAQDAERARQPLRALEFLARATPYLPERRTEFEGRWRRLGERALQAQGRTLQQYRQLFSLQSRGRPNAALNSWATVEIARQELERGRPAQAITLVRRRLEDLPYFPPLLEVASDAYAADGDWARAISAWLRLGEHYGYTPALAERLAAVPREAFPPADLVAWAALDPRRALLSGVVRDLMARDQVDLALQAIRYLGGEATTSEEYLLAGDLSLAQRDWATAHDSLAKIPVDDPVFPRAAAPLLRAAVERGEPRAPGSALVAALARIHAAPRLDPERFPAAIDAMFARGLAPEADALTALLDADASARDPALLLRRAVAAAAVGDVAAAEEALDRVSIYADEDAELIGRLLLGIDQDDEEAIRQAALALIVGPLIDDPLRGGIVRLLYGDVDRALPLLARADQEHEGLHFVSRFSFLTALAIARADQPEATTGDRRLDQELAYWQTELGELSDSIGPRPLLALLLAIESEPWAGWASTRLVQLAPLLGQRPWAVMLSAHASAELGRYEEARRLAQAMSRPRANMPWSWVLLEQIGLELAGDEVDFQVVRARVGRVLAVGARGLDPAETPKLVAEVLMFLGRPKAARRALELGLRNAPQEDRRRSQLLLDLARATSAAGDSAAAVEYYEELLHARDPEEFFVYVPELLEHLDRLRRQDRITGTSYFARLESLAARFPEDPAPVRAIAEHLLASGEELQSSPVSRAVARLDRFRDATRGVPLERLRRGEAQHWVAVYEELDPDAAVALAYEELLHAPYALELWRTWADALRAARRYGEALEVFRILAAVVPDAASMKSLARVLLEGAEDPRLALAAAVQARTRSADGGRDPELSLIEAHAQTLTSEQGFEPGTRALRQLLTQALAGTVDLTPWRVAQPLVEALVWHARPADLAMARQIAEETAATLAAEDGLRAAWFRAMGLLAEQDRR